MTWPAIPHPKQLRVALKQLSEHMDDGAKGCPVPDPANDELTPNDLDHIADWDALRACLVNIIAVIDLNKASWSFPRCGRHKKHGKHD
jgi:hypothetical protein